MTRLNLDVILVFCKVYIKILALGPVQNLTNSPQKRTTRRYFKKDIFMLLVYVSSPYTGFMDKEKAVALQIKIWNALRMMSSDIVPVLPLLYHYVERVYHTSHEDWLQMDLALLERCDALLCAKIDGLKSNGCELELQHAESNNIPVYYNFKTLNNYINNLQKRRTKCPKS